MPPRHSVKKQMLFLKEIINNQIGGGEVSAPSFLRKRGSEVEKKKKRLQNQNISAEII